MKGSHNVRDPDELERMTKIARESTARELQRFFRMDSSHHFARAMGIPYAAGEWPQCIKIEEHFAAIRNNEEQEHDHEPGVCDCQIPEGLRWTFVDDGEPVLWYLDIERQHQYMMSEFLSCINYAYSVWSSVCDIKFKQAQTAREAHTVWRYAPLEEGTLGITWMPRSGESMDVNGRCPLCGDITWNSNERWDPVKKRAVSVHEVGHSIGLNHNDDPAGLMAAFWRGQTELMQSDIAPALVKYPYDDTPRTT